MSRRVAVVTDSAASIPPALAAQWGVGVVPLQVVIDGEPHAEGVDLSAAEVIVALNSRASVTTSQPSVGAFEAVFAAAAAAGAEAVVAVTLSGEISGTFNAAVVAASTAPVPVTVVDSRTVAMATGYAALSAAAVARTGAGADEVAAEARRVAASSTCVFTVDTLEYLRRSGRVSPAIAAIGTALHLRPVLAMVDGEIALVERVRTTARARALVVSMVGTGIAKLERPGLAVMALGADEFADAAVTDITGRHPRVAMAVRSQVSAVLAVHTGPGTFAAVSADLPVALG